jgi:ferritin-like metal-binding protein YciE
VPTRLGNARDLFLALAGEALYVERRLVGEVLPALIAAVAGDDLRSDLEAHLEQTRGHVDACAETFLALEAAPSAAYSDAFEGLVRQHGKVAATIVTPMLADVWHATAAAQTEHLEIGLYRAAVELGRAHDFSVSRLEAVLVQEEDALVTMEAALDRLVADARG